MCNLSIGVFNDGFDKGIAKGIEQGIAKGIEQGIDIGFIKKAVEVVKKLLTKSYPLEEALEIAGIDQETYEQYLENENGETKA